MDLRLELMNRLAGGERAADLQREYGISKKTLQKFRQRYAQQGAAGLADLSRAPLTKPLKTPPELEDVIVAERHLHPTWGPKKLKAILERRLERTLPAASTIGDILVRRGITEKRPTRTRYPRPSPTGLVEATAPNDTWCIDYKGEFRLGDRSYCYPLTVTDQFSRYVLACEGMAAISDHAAREVCADLFQRYGLPTRIRSDNGTPFASTGLLGLSRLSVLWLRLDIQLERIRPGTPQENGQHERMHRTLKAETTRPARANLLQQQERFDAFVTEFNCVRPHEALAQQPPASVYRPSLRACPSTLPELQYPTHDDTMRIDRQGGATFRRKRYYLSQALACETVGLREQLDGRWLVTFKHLDLGHFADGRFVPASAPGGSA